MKKKIILGLTATAAIATPVVAVISCGSQSIDKQNTQTSTEYVGGKTAQELQLDKAKAESEAAAKAAEAAKVEQDRIAAEQAKAAEAARLAQEAADKVAQELAKAEQDKLAEQARKAEADRLEAERLAAEKAAEQTKAAEAAKTQEEAGLNAIKESFANVLAPYTVDTYQAAYAQTISPILNQDNSIHAEGYTSRTSATTFEAALENTMRPAFAGSIQGFGNSYPMMLSSKFNVIKSFVPATDSNMGGANFHASINLNKGPFGKNGAEWSGDFAKLKISGGTSSNPDQIYIMKKALDVVAKDTNFVSLISKTNTLLFSFDETNGTLNLWYKGVRTLPTASSLIKSTWSDSNEDVIQLRKAIPGLQASDMITPEKYLALIKYFFVTPSAEANHKLATASWFNWMNNYSATGDANGFNHTFKLTSPLTWSFDDYTANNLGLNAGQVVANDGQGYAYNNANFYTSDTVSNYETAAYEQQFDTYGGHIRAKAWIFEHMFYGFNQEDGASATWGGVRYHDGYNRKPDDSIDFMKDTYRLFVTTHVDPANQDNQVIDYMVKYAPTGQIVYRESVVNPGANPDARHMFDNVDWSQMQQVISQQAATREITLQEFMNALLKAQSALKSFNSLSSKYLADPFVGHLVDLLANANVDLRTLPTSVAQRVFDLMKERKDININLFVNTVSQDSSYIQSILMGRTNNHYALSIKSLQFDNVINAMLGLARELSPESFKHGDLSHI